MLLVSFSKNIETCVGVLERNASSIIDLSAVEDVPDSMLELIRVYNDPNQLIAKIDSCNDRIPVSSVTLLAPIPRPPRNIFCIGKNYRDHIKEIQSAMSSDNINDAEAPIFFTKATSAVIGPGVNIPASEDKTASVDYEGELAVIIGKGGKNISEKNALQHIFGYSILNDVTSRRIQKKHQQWFLGKSLDGFCPMGPGILTSDEVADLSSLRVETRVNGELRQNGRVSDMIYDIPAIIAVISEHITLEAGDIIATGTPAGVGMGFTPAKFLQPGDTVSITIEPIGCLENPVA